MIEQEKEKTQKNGLTLKQMAVILGILTLLAAGIWGFNTYRLKNITVDGLTRYTKEEFLEKLETGPLDSLTPLFCLSDTFLQRKIPFVETYEITYTDSHSARILVHEKRVTGCVIVMGRYMFFDKDGIVVETADACIEGVPVITGLEFNEIALYQKLKIQKQSLFDTILELTRLIEKNELAVNEISFNSVYEVTLSLDDITVYLGKRTSYDEVLHALKEILVSIQGRSGTLDMRNYTKENGEVILKTP